MSLIQKINVAGQSVWILDLKLSKLQRQHRRTALYHSLKELLHHTNDVVHPLSLINQNDNWKLHRLAHRINQPAQLEWIDQTGQLMHCDVAISYALPYAAVVLGSLHVGQASFQPHDGRLNGIYSAAVAVDLCAVSDFDTMSAIEKHIFCQDYFPEQLVTELSDQLAYRWSRKETALKRAGLSLSAIHQPEFQHSLLHSHGTIVTQCLTLHQQRFYVSVAYD